MKLEVTRRTREELFLTIDKSTDDHIALKVLRQLGITKATS
ncbi:Uncharacterised protein [Pseudomonas luteola]|uniref:Uncharacterized protein n=1 Tax=Pseudomonas luteola TaxID=47886 RepID=A0A2X2CPM9_PSELU|nr:Uncharacterised protein [Pseudomonas luteola]